ncbi:MAG: hypothetical protein Q8M84_06685, partial [Thiobacillus sp.]|nr:hypothetical protein [Thiobacillus sp.]
TSIREGGAEGVEPAGQEAFLQQHGCVLAQGYYHARPMPEGERVPLLLDAPLLPGVRTVAAI